MEATHDATRFRADAEKLADIFTFLQRKFVLNLSKELTRGKVSFPQYLLLGFLAQHGSPLSMTETAQRMRHTTAAATGLVSRLEKLGYVRRQIGAKDRRKVLVQISEKGVQLVTNIREDMTDNIIRLMSHLDDNEQRTWLCIYEKVYIHCQQ